jgi:hypothetical protein
MFQYVQLRTWSLFMFHGKLFFMILYLGLCVNTLSGHDTVYDLTKLLMYWHDNRQRLPIRRLLCLLETHNVIV